MAYRAYTTTLTSPGAPPRPTASVRLTSPSHVRYAAPATHRNMIRSSSNLQDNSIRCTYTTSYSKLPLAQFTQPAAAVKTCLKLGPARTSKVPEPPAAAKSAESASQATTTAVSTPAPDGAKEKPVETKMMINRSAIELRSALEHGTVNAEGGHGGTPSLNTVQQLNALAMRTLNEEGDTSTAAGSNPSDQLIVEVAKRLRDEQKRLKELQQLIEMTTETTPSLQGVRTPRLLHRLLCVQASTVALHRLLCVPIQPGALSNIPVLMNGDALKEAMLKSQGLSELDLHMPSKEELVVYCRFDGEAGLQSSEAKVEQALQLLSAHFVGIPQCLSATGGTVTPGGLKVWSLRGKPPVVQHRMLRVAVKPGSIEDLTSRARGPEVQQAFQKILGLQAVEIIAVSGESVITQYRYESTEALQASEAKAQEVLAFVSDYATCSPECFSACGGTVNITGTVVWSFPKSETEEPAEVIENSLIVEVKPEEPLVEVQSKAAAPPKQALVQQRADAGCCLWFLQRLPNRKMPSEPDMTVVDEVMGA